MTEAPHKSAVRVLAVVPAWNEAHRVAEKVLRLVPADEVDEVLLVDDGSTDDTRAVAEAAGATVITHARNRGVGAAIRTGIEYARSNGFDAVVVLNAAGKYDPRNVRELLQPLRDGRADLVQGSRYLHLGRYRRMPAYRRLATRFYSTSFTALLGHRVTDGTCGIRAFTLDVFRHRAMDLDQAWLDSYELEPYLLWKTIELGFRVIEVPIELLYPRADYTRMRAGTDWWRIYRPLVLLRLGLKR